jgi:glycosyltransferase involved in cell wall biosynthesis
LRIADVTQWFDPEPNVIKGLAFVQALQAAGHEVTVVTGFPNYPDGRIYAGYRLRPVQHEMIDGVRVVRLPLYPSHDRSSLRRSLNFCSFFVSVFAYLALRRSRFDLAYVYHPPITVGLAAALLRIPFVLDVQDLWPDTIAATGMAGASRLQRPIGTCCRFVYARAAAIATQSEGIRAALIGRGVPAEKITVIRNWADPQFEGLPLQRSERGPFTLVYGGNLGRAQQLVNLMQAAAILQRERPDIQIKLFGSGLDEAQLRKTVARDGLANVQFTGRVSAAEMAQEFAKADALLLHLGDDPLFAITIPSKTQTYLALGRPIVAAVNGEAAEILRESGAAIVVPPANPPALAEAIKEMADLPEARRIAMGRSGAEFYARHFSFSQGVARTLALLEGTYTSVTGGRCSK